MNPKRSGLSDFLGELKRRHVVRAVIGYAAVVFVVLQAGEIVFPAFDAPEWGLRVLVLLSLLGFPLVVVLAWVFELTPEGLRRTRHLDVGSGHVPVGDLMPRLAALGVTVLAVGGAGWWVVQGQLMGSGAGRVAPDIAATSVAAGDFVPVRSLAVLPLTNFSETGVQDYFSAGMHESLLTQLSQIDGLRVVSRTSVMRYENSDKTIPEIARELGVEGIIEGSVLRAGDSVRITVQLIHAATDTHLWSQEYIRPFENILGLQSEVAHDIAHKVQRELTQDDEARLATAATVPVNPEAEEAYLRARFEQSRGTPESLEDATGLYEVAIEMDSTFAPAYAGLAGSQLLMVLRGLVSPDEGLPEAADAAARAMELDGSLPEATEVFSVVRSRVADEMGDSERGVAILSKLDSVAPGIDSMIVVAMNPWSQSLTEIGRQVETAMAMSGRGKGEAPVRLVIAAREKAAAGEHQEAMKLLHESVAMAPQLPIGWDALEHAYVIDGDYVGAVDVLRERAEKVGEDPAVVAKIDLLAQAVAERGAEGYWEARLQYLDELANHGEKVSQVDYAAAQLALGRVEEALASLEKAHRDHDRKLVTIRTDPVWDSIRTHPRFKGLVSQLWMPPPRPPRPRLPS